jgi:hypothetical protein
MFQKEVVAEEPKYRRTPGYNQCMLLAQQYKLTVQKMAVTKQESSSSSSRWMKDIFHAPSPSIICLRPRRATGLVATKCCSAFAFESHDDLS